MDDIPVPLPAIPTRFMDRFRAFIRARHLAPHGENLLQLGKGIYPVPRKAASGIHGRRRGKRLAEPIGKHWAHLTRLRKAHRYRSVTLPFH